MKNSMIDGAKAQLHCAFLSCCFFGLVIDVEECLRSHVKLFSTKADKLIDAETKTVEFAVLSIIFFQKALDEICNIC